LINEVSLSLEVKNYLKDNIKSDENILVLISCGLDSTVLFNLIIESRYLKNKNIYYLIFDHQKRPEGKYEIKKFTEFYNLLNKNIFIKKIHSNINISGFQQKSRASRYNFLYSLSKKKNIKNIFLGHHLDDLNETFFMRKIQQSGAPGLSKIFSQEFKGLKLHRPLKIFSKTKIKSYADRKKLIWFEDRSNYELDYSRNKIRHFLYSNKLSSKVNKERLNFSKTSQIQNLYEAFFKRKKNKIFEIEIKKFNNLNENLKFLVIQSFYYRYRNLLKKQIRDENIKNFIRILKPSLQNGLERSVFSGKIGVFNKKICINLT
tara:strand:+ start:3459 stop:4412 length:954 start_codon:yes stop_codon:yes gene_type:complete